MWSRSFLSSAPSGSSSRSTAGRVTSARASATRCCSPPESWLGIAPAVAGELDERQGLGHPPRDLRPVHALHAQAEAHVLGDGAVREERVVLEHHADAAGGAGAPG